MADRRLQVFHTVARLLSFTKAAESLHMTQPAVTFQVRQLEEQFNTRLLGGAPEPVYLPTSMPGECHRLHYRDDYFASALHEVAHWCIAGPGRRRVFVFGYWYVPDGRSAAQQRAFEQVEFRPQAMEWHFARACGYPFRVSLDNLECDGAVGASGSFKRRVWRQARHWDRVGLPRRAHRFALALCREFGRECGDSGFILADLD